ncbi:hypothetical protein Focb16_v005379 [Fusarium oxysporum f. sp. cubense]|uniref:Uncharacterized protein n=1 Tax=Fusarium oxysporum f. sp. cubense TaxID=61366 RepID=A0A559LLT6_FUSOC|nr:hypothetical protein Focb16_v005379 [Fusarium oxysporum f. sp. cubense]
MKRSFALNALMASSLAAAYNVVIAPTEYKQLQGLNIVAKNGGFFVTNKGTPADFEGGDGTLKVNGQPVYIGPEGHVGYGKAPSGAVTSGWIKDSEELHWTKGAIFACPDVSFNVGTPTAYELYANHEGTPNGQGDDCFSVHLAMKHS